MYILFIHFQNIELNVQVESLRNDVCEKQELLKKA